MSSTPRPATSHRRGGRTVATVGPELNLVRTYNSLDPRRDGVFGAGWTSRYDMTVVADNDGSGNVVITYPDGQAGAVRQEPDGTYAAPPGRIAKLSSTAPDGQLVDRTGRTYQFSAHRQLTKIIDMVRAVGQR